MQYEQTKREKRLDKIINVQAVNGGGSGSSG